MSTGFRDLGYRYVLLDDGWPACAEFRPTGTGACKTVAPRLADGRVEVDPQKFPPSKPGANDGLKLVADHLHGLGLKLGIYTAPHGRTCGDYWGLLGHEAIDTQMYADWVRMRSIASSTTTVPPSPYPRDGSHTHT